MTERDQQSENDAELEQEILRGRKFDPKEAMARMAGPGAMKGGSPIPRTQQAETEIGTWLSSHVADTAGALHLVLHQQLRSSELLLNNLDQPLAALAGHCEKILASDFLLKELVRQVDAEWGRRTDERPYFDREGSPPHQNDPYTLNSVRERLQAVVDQLAAAKGE